MLKFNQTFRKLTALMLAVMLGASLLPASALAAGESSEDPASAPAEEEISGDPASDEMQEIPEMQTEIQESTEDGSADPILADEAVDPDEAAEGLVEFAADSSPEFEFHYTSSATGGWAGFGANLIDENGDEISATVTGDYTINSGRYTTTVTMPYAFSIEDFTKVFTTNGTYLFQYATVTDPNYGDEEHEFDVWPNEEKVGANELYGSKDNPVVSVMISETAASANPNYGSETINSRTWHFTLTYADDTSVTIPIYGNADGANDNGGKYCPKYLEINLFYEQGVEAVLNLGNGNGTYCDGDYTGSSGSGGSALRYGTGILNDYVNTDGTVTINLPSDSDLNQNFTVVDAIGTEGEEGYQPAVIITLGKEEAYDYKLIGWINIATGEYYDVSGGSKTAVIDASDDNVFYADWIAASYDHGSSDDANLRDDTVSTSSFVTLQMFDYNELFNLYSTELVKNGTASEEWTDSGSMYNELLLANNEEELTPIADSFIFQNSGTTTGNSHVLSHANPLRWNLWTANAAWNGYDEYQFVLDAEKYWNITSPSSTILGMLYDTEEKSLGVHYVGDADYLFWVDENGYYTYDSAVSGAAYNQSEGRFYVYGYDEDEENGFFPYNTHKDGSSSSNGLKNYWFGVYMDVNMYLPSATNAGTEEKAVNQINGEDMVFDFSGDDDIMIFIDGKMVVDMSGIHSRSYSRINFSTNTVTYSMGLDEKGAPDTTGAGGKYYIDDNLDLSAGSHTMQVFYMERGASASNLKIQFNVAPVWEYETGDVQTVTAEKVWEDSEGNKITDTENMPDVEVGLFDALGPAVAATEDTEGTFGYTKDGTKYTVTYEDDSGATHTYVYDSSGPTLDYTEVDSDGTTITGTDDQTDSDGRVVDKDGLVVAWLDEETLHIRIDMQTLNEENGWSYAWELLDADGSYEALELSEDSRYTTTSESEDLTNYLYWSVIGDAELEEILSNEEERVPIILTEAAQEAESTLGDTKEAKGYVIVATEDGVHTEQVDFSQKATMEAITNGNTEDSTETEKDGDENDDEGTGQTTTWRGTYGVTSQSEIDALGPGALWYPVDSGKTHTDSDGNEIKGFYLFCQLDSMTYYLTLDELGENLTVTTDPEEASEFYYDLLGEFMVSTVTDGVEDAVRVEIDEEGNIMIGTAEWEAALDDVRIYTLSETLTGGFAFTATNILQKVDIEGSKVWDDADNQDGLRPNSIVVYLLADGERVSDEDGNDVMAEVTPDADGNWTFKFTDLDKGNDDGAEIQYSIEEISVTGYDTTISELTEETDPDTGEGTGVYTITIENKHTPETIDISGEKVWDDADNQDGKRPASVTVNLLADGEPVLDESGNAITATLTETNNWTFSFTNLPKYKEGKEIQYNITENAVTDYSTDITITQDEDTGDYIVVVENSYTPEKTSVNVIKVWDDKDNQDGCRSDAITVTLLANGEDTGKTMVLDASNNWQGSFAELDVYTSGQEITYTISEISVNKYDTVITGDGTTGFVITNTHEPETVSVEGTKTWDDADNQDGKRPESITIHLLADGVVVDSQEVTTADGWTWSFTGLDRYRDGGIEIVYTVTEETVDGYTSEVNGYDVTNSYMPETTEVTGSKTWDDANNQDGKRPASITIHLFADGVEVDSQEVTALDDWSWSFTDLDKYRDGGIEIVYTVTEDAVESYETAYSEDGDVITNTHTPETIDIEGTKTWEDNDNQDGERPESITIRLYADGEPALDENGDQITATVTAEDGWSWSFTDLDKYRDGGTEIAYTVTEDVITSGDYSATIDGFDITNAYTPEKTSLHVQKVWLDDRDRDGVRPESITVILTADGEETDQTLELSEENSWSGDFTDLDKYKDGTEIEYSVSEKMYGNAYVTRITDLEDTAAVYIYNEHIAATTEISGSKIWDDADDQDGIRPAEIIVRLLADGTAALDANSDPITATVTAEDNWSFSFTDLPKYHDQGVEIVYTVSEDATDGYETTIEGTAITNTHTPETIDLPVEKVWDDDDNAYNHRPDFVEVGLVANGADTETTITLSEENGWADTFTDLDKYKNGEEIAYTVKELSDEALQYYTPKITYNDDDSVTIVNRREYFDIDEEIVVDESDRDTWVKRESVNEYNAIEFEMSTYLPVIETDELGNGDFTMNFHEVLDSELVLDDADADFAVEIAGLRISHDYYTVEISPDDGCSFHVDVDLTALYKNGIVTEDMLDGNTEIMIFFYADLEGTGLNGSYTSTVWYEVYDGDEQQYESGRDVVSVYTYEIEIEKYDSSDTEEKLAGAAFGLFYDAACTLPVSRNGEDYTVLSDEDGMAVFYGLAGGTYYVKELQAPVGYILDDTPIEAVLGEDLNDSGYAYFVDFANTPDVPEPGEEPEPEKSVDTNEDNIFIDGGKDVNIGDTLTYEIRYYNYSEEAATITITDCLDAGLDFVEASDGGKYENDSRTITWVIEDMPGVSWGSVTFTAVVNETALVENRIENTASVQVNNDEAKETNPVENPVTELRQISGAKEWKDNNDKADARPDSITVNLYRSDHPDEVYDSKVVTEADGWAWSWTDLPKYDADGNAYAYTINENEVEYYTATYYTDGNFNITNTFVGEEGAEHPTSGPDKGGDTPKTGDTNNIGLWLALLAAALACVLVVFRMRKRA